MKVKPVSITNVRETRMTQKRPHNTYMCVRCIYICTVQYLLRNSFKDSGKSWTTKLISWREVCSSNKGFKIGCEKNTHRPASPTLGSLDVGHVYFIHIWTLLTVNLRPNVNQLIFIFLSNSFYLRPSLFTPILLSSL